MADSKTCKICKWNILTIAEEENGVCGECKKHAETFIERVIRMGEVEE